MLRQRAGGRQFIHFLHFGFGAFDQELVLEVSPADSHQFIAVGSPDDHLPIAQNLRSHIQQPEGVHHILAVVVTTVTLIVGVTLFVTFFHPGPVLAVLAAVLFVPIQVEVEIPGGGYALLHTT